ncbi:anaerobic coproporphyrinogen III oxidase [Sinobaca qinghaiensis]|uniref:Heme chaperone HemW n=1 Tax=Sinobaca qinghaiensis TaxID=342944 RepID=A0A419V3R7_9BACL|nr:radical SAM family heme chaperone HemW [Sinobaca qinghaiensis]RKD73046.1 anaerobic coproporphyrinogen III oxidase [Sinobaca qinghaiensis]
MAVTSAYIHIPFCRQICFYCDFNKFLIDRQPVDQYLDALEQEIRQANISEPLDSIYIGGGTPTALNEAQVKKMLDIVDRLVPLAEGAEYTVEVNPGEITMEKLAAMKNSGVNRLSIGVQSFETRLLEVIGRGHGRDDAVEAVKLAERAGFDNYSIDLMFGLPGQTMADFQASLDMAVSLNVPHISAYSLKIEEKTMFHNWYKQGRLTPFPEDTEADMYELLLDYGSRNGLYPYEISNLAAAGYESFHNCVYWKNEEYYGFGAGAHGYVDGMRYANIAPLTHYIKALEQGNTVVKEEMNVSSAEKMEEEMFLGLRMYAGVDKSRFKERYGMEYKEVFASTVPDLLENGLIEDDGEKVKLTPRGRLLGNEVFEKFLLEKDDAS